MSKPEDDVEVEYIRKLCIPELILLLHTVLHDTQKYKEAVQLADIVASNNHNLFECFHKENMRNFLDRVKQSSIEMLNN